MGNDNITGEALIARRWIETVHRTYRSYAKVLELSYSANLWIFVRIASGFDFVEVLMNIVGTTVSLSNIHTLTELDALCGVICGYRYNIYEIPSISENDLAERWWIPGTVSGGRCYHRDDLFDGRTPVRTRVGFHPILGPLVSISCLHTIAYLSEIHYTEELDVFCTLMFGGITNDA